MDLIIEVGSYQLIVSKIFIEEDPDMEIVANKSYVEFTIYESPDDTIEKRFVIYSGNSVGRK